MKVKIKAQDVTFYGLQVAAWLVFLMVPAISAFAANNSWEDAWRAIQFSSRIMWIPAAIFFVNSFVLIPFGYYRNRRWLFWLGNAVIFGLLAWHYFGIETPAFMEHLPNERAKRYAVTSYYSTSVLSIFMDILLAGIALLIAAMSAKGTSRIDNIEQIDRGYENIEERLNALGAKINRLP